jgi:hypothetical protein
LAGPVANDQPYSAGATAGAVILSLFMPVIALIIALVLRSQELGPKRKQFLKNWAVGSVAWLCTGWLNGIIAFNSASSGPSGCGTETKPVPSSEVPGGG